jgi:hypothetical protein
MRRQHARRSTEGCRAVGWSSASSSMRASGNSVRGLSGSSCNCSMGTTCDGPVRASTAIESLAVERDGSLASQASMPSAASGTGSCDAVAAAPSKSNCSPLDLVHSMRMPASCRDPSMRESGWQDQAQGLGKSQHVHCALRTSDERRPRVTHRFNFPHCRSAERTRHAWSTKT